MSFGGTGGFDFKSRSGQSTYLLGTLATSAPSSSSSDASAWLRGDMLGQLIRDRLPLSPLGNDEAVQTPHGFLQA